MITDVVDSSPPQKKKRKNAISSESQLKHKKGNNTNIKNFFQPLFKSKVVEMEQLPSSSSSSSSNQNSVSHVVNSIQHQKSTVMTNDHVWHQPLAAKDTDVNYYDSASDENDLDIDNCADSEYTDAYDNRKRSTTTLTVTEREENVYFHDNWQYDYYVQINKMWLTVISKFKTIILDYSVLKEIEQRQKIPLIFERVLQNLDYISFGMNRSKKNDLIASESIGIIFPYVANQNGFSGGGDGSRRQTTSRIVSKSGIKQRNSFSVLINLKKIPVSNVNDFFQYLSFAIYFGPILFKIDVITCVRMPYNLKRYVNARECMPTSVRKLLGKCTFVFKDD